MTHANAIKGRINRTVLAIQLRLGLWWNFEPVLPIDIRILPSHGFLESGQVLFCTHSKQLDIPKIAEHFEHEDHRTEFNQARRENLL